MDLHGWLKANKVSMDAYDPDQLLSAFLREMEAGLYGAPGSLAMIPAHLSVAGKGRPGQWVAVIDAGGTNLRTGLARFSDAGDVELSNVKKQPIPGRDVEVSASEFYRVLVNALVPVQDQFDAIGFCFSYPATITPDHDGVLMHWTKEIKIPELVGAHIGAGLIDALEARGVAGKRVVVLNDTVAALLAGVSIGETFAASSYVGFILGTGSNTAYVEQNSKIRKLKDGPTSGSQVINVESGAFSRFERGPADLALDADSVNPGKHIFEKTISGVYMGALTLRLLKALVEEDVFSGSAADAIRRLTRLSTIDVDGLCQDDERAKAIFSPDVYNRADLEVITTVFGAVVDRASLLAAVNISAAVIKSGCGADPSAPVCVNIDGSTYYKTAGMQDKVQRVLRQLMAARGLHVRSIRIDDAPVVGAAIAGLTAI